MSATQGMAGAGRFIGSNWYVKAERNSNSSQGYRTLLKPSSSFSSSTVSSAPSAAAADFPPRGLVLKAHSGYTHPVVHKDITEAVKAARRGLKRDIRAL